MTDVDKEQDILLDLVAYSTQDQVLSNMLHRAAQEIVHLRSSLKPFANWSNKITCADIDNAKRMLEGRQEPLLEVMTKMARGEL